MKKRLTKILSAMLVFVMVMCLVPPVEAAASKVKKPTFDTDMLLNYYPKAGKDWISCAMALNNNYEDNSWKITKLKSSNTKVLTVKKIDNYSGIMITPKKAGKSTITFKATKGSKTYSYKCVVKVMKYENPVKTLKIGSKNYASKFSKMDYIDLDGKKNYEGKLSIKTNKNWKVTYILIYDAKTDKVKEYKNNKKIKLKKNQSLYIYFTNTKNDNHSCISILNQKW